VPRFDEENPVHQQVATLSQQAHIIAPLAYAGDANAQAQLTQIEAQVDEAAAALWGLTPAELEDVRASLVELGARQEEIEEEVEE
jgi:hypothetical protein